MHMPGLLRQPDSLLLLRQMGLSLKSFITPNATVTEYEFILSSNNAPDFIKAVIQATRCISSR